MCGETDVCGMQSAEASRKVRISRSAGEMQERRGETGI